MKVKLYRKWIEIVKSSFKDHFMARDHEGLCLLCARIWKYGHSKKLVESNPQVWMSVSGKGISSSGEYLSRIWKNFAYKYRKYSRRYWTAKAKLMRAIEGKE